MLYNKLAKSHRKHTLTAEVLYIPEDEFNAANEYYAQYKRVDKLSKQIVALKDMLRKEKAILILLTPSDDL